MDHNTSKKVFNMYLNLSSSIGKVVIAYYGVSGHGKGIVDAMSSFGVKEPLRKEIVQKDFWYTSSKDIFDFLTKEKANEKMYVLSLTTKRRSVSKKKGLWEISNKGVQKTTHDCFFPRWHHTDQRKHLFMLRMYTRKFCELLGRERYHLQTR